MKRLFILFMSFTIVAGMMISCKKKADAVSEKTGSVTFSTSCYWCSPYTVNINGNTGTIATGVNNAPACGTVNSNTVNFTLPVGTYSFTITGRTGIANNTYHGPNSVTITENGCASVFALSSDF